MSIVIEPLWKNAFRALTEQELLPGKVIPRKKLEELFELKEPTTVEQYKQNQLLFLSEMDRLKDALLTQAQVALRAVPGEGYEVVRPEDQTKYGINQGMKRIAKDIRWMAKTVANVDTSKLTTDQRKENADGLARIAMLSSMKKKIAKASIT